MGQLAELARSYKDGAISFDDLVERVKGFKFKVRDPVDTKDARHEEWDGTAGAVEDTFDELSRFWARGLLTRQELTDLLKRVVPERV